MTSEAPQSPAALHWDAEGLWLALRPLLPDLSVEVLASCPSTNSALLERARLAQAATADEADADAPAPDAPRRRRDDQPPAKPRGRRAGDRQPCLLVAEHQTQGRGRLGRQWHASPGASLTFSLALPLQPADWSGLSLAVGLALAEALDPQASSAGAARIGLKWPNDLWLRDVPGAGRKLGGVLIETVALGGDARMVVVGVGLNVLPQSLGELGSGYACLQELDPAASAPAALHHVALPLVHALLDFEHDGFAPLASAFAARDLLAGQPVTTTQPGLPAGIAEGVAPDGALRVRVDGTLHRLTSGEVSVRLQAGGPPPG